MLFGQGATKDTIDDAQRDALVERCLEAWAGDGVKRVLLIPPDHTRLNSFAGPITATMYERLTSLGVAVDVLPALGTHKAMSPDKLRLMFGETIPLDRFLVHRWDEGLEHLGQIDAEEVDALSEGRLGRAGITDDMPVAVNPALVSDAYDLVVSIGQVVPHEVIGMANYTKNLMIGVGGKPVIDRSHFLGAVYGMERMMGRADTPVRTLLNAAFDRFVRPKANVKFVLTVVEDVPGRGATLRGFYAGDDSEAFNTAAELSKAVNFDTVDEPIETCVVYLDPEEFTSTWLGMKALYRTRMAMADGGRLIVLAPGLEEFGENPRTDPLIRKYGYHGTEHTLDLLRNNDDLRTEVSVAAHLIHGSSEGRFEVTYATGDAVSEADVRGVGLDWMRYDDAVQTYDPEAMSPGWNDVAGERLFFVPNPALGLWALRGRV
ncbi:MAG: lactate racemase domain-containing protein [Planctomycetota bacterium]